MKKIFITILLAALMPFAAGAQDARQRTAETIVADALAQLPAQTPKAFDSLMQELAATGADGIRMMAAMLVPAAEGKNAPVEYAINGVVSYVTAAGREELAREIRAGLTDAVAASTDKPNQAFLLSQLQLCATAAEAPVFVKYAADEYLADYAVRGLISTPGTDGEILALIDASPAPDALLAYAAAEKRLAAAEPALLKWAADPKTGTPTKEAVYNALAKCGTAASIAPLAAAAKADGYAFTKTDATGAYVALLARLAAAGNSKAVAAAKALRKTGMPQNVRAAGLGIVLGTDAKKQTPELLAALKDADREYRCAALDFAGDFADDALYAAVVKKMPSLSDAAKTDVVSWLGARHAASQSRRRDRRHVVGRTRNWPWQPSAPPGRSADRRRSTHSIAQLGGAHAKEASAALAAFNGKPNAAFVAALDGDARHAGQRPETRGQAAHHDRGRQGIRPARTPATRPCARQPTTRWQASRPPADFDRLCDLLNKAQGGRREGPAGRIEERPGAGESPDMQYKMVAGHAWPPPPQKARYYPLLAQAASEEAIDALLAADDRESRLRGPAHGRRTPRWSTCSTNSPGRTPTWTDAAISRYTDFVNGLRQYAACANTSFTAADWKRNPSAKVQNKLLKALSRTPVFPALTLAMNYMDAPATAETAAMVVKTVAAKNPALGGETVAAALKKAQEVYAGLAKSDADAGYAVDEIKGLLAKLPAEPDSIPVSLEPENRKAVVGNPETRKAMKPKALAKAQLEADAAMAQKWSLTDGILTAQANAPAIQFPKQYENFEMILDWKTPGEAGIAVRAIPQIRLGGVSGTGMLADDKGVADADNRPGNWNTLYVKVVDDRITVFENDVKIVENAVMTNPDMPGEPVGICAVASEPAHCRKRGSRRMSAKCICRRAACRRRVFELSAEEAAEGFEVLFDGTVAPQMDRQYDQLCARSNGTIDVTAQYGGSGNLYTKKEYSDFVLRFEFRLRFGEGVNNGIGIRTPMGVDAAYRGHGDSDSRPRRTDLQGYAKTTSSMVRFTV